MISVLSLFYGIEQKQPKYLKPFLYVGVLWNLALLLLLIFCLIELIVAGEHFCEQIELTLNDFLDGVRGEPTTMSSFETPAFFNEFGAYSTSESKHSNLAIQLFGEDQSRSDDQPALTEYSTETTNSQTPIWPALTLLSALLIAILIDCWLLNIVLITYLYLERGKRREII
uniref:G_PROTEIN_RECEP_F1_2 domain-containing protein n=1 Tax=Meloidogyne hapla TaxID=6305 RepID=A0A1I8C0K1_MELHA